MQDRPIIVSNGNNTRVLAIVAVLVIVAIVLFVSQPWSASFGAKSSTTIIDRQPAGAGAGAAGGSSGSTTTTT
jgi:hypothetical protein